MTNTSAPDETVTENAKSHFAKAIDEARAGAQALADGYREKIMATTGELSSEAKARSDEAMEKANAFATDARDKANTFADDAMAKAGVYAADAKAKATGWANDGKAMTSRTIATLAGMIDENIAMIDDKAGEKYGDYARSASQSMKDAAASLDEKSLDELGEDAVDFVRKSPGVAIGAAIAAGFMLGRMFKGK
ncbi:hypothetical protein [Novosphingobium colocasiae]|nr:hypothetical protein [Novosphingobium colocasiae]